MPPADNTPDFDSMSPEEIMAWMETLAKRQGADEGFTTAANVQIADIDPATAKDTGPGYIPYGMSEEQWEKKQADEAVKKAAKAAAAPPPVPAVQAVPTPPAPQPIAAPPPAAAPAPAASAGDTPDFDSMSPEELMAWMETLAERQGASEGFTTTKRVDIAEIDPATAKDTGPGYIPYGMSEEQWEKKQADEAAKKAAKAAAAPPPPAPVMPIAPPPIMAEVPLPPAEPQFELPSFDFDLEGTTQITPSSGGDGLAWLESLASGSGSDFPQMDLSGLGSDIAPLDLDALSGSLDLGSFESLTTPAAAEANPIDWLQGLSQEEESPFSFSPTPPAATTPPPAERFSKPTAASADDDEDPMEFLESLAKRQGARPEEFTTSAGLDVPLPEETAPAPGYTAFTFEQESFGASNILPDLDDLEEVDAEDVEDPQSWLDQLASAQKPSFIHDETFEPATTSLVEDAKNDRVMQALSSAQNVSPEDIKGWMDNLLDKGANLSDDIGLIEDDEDEAGEPELQAQIPDWLLDQVGPPPEAVTVPRKPEQPALIDQIVEPEAIDIPDWLRTEENTFENIFAFTEEESARPAIAASSELPDVDVNDPWVEAFELEYAARQVEPVSELSAPVAPALEQAFFAPERDLPAGEPEALPDWLALSSTDHDEYETLEVEYEEEDSESEAVSDIPDWLREQYVPDNATETFDIVAEDLPDWLKEAGVEKTDTVPDWLIDTITVEVEQPEFAGEAEPMPAPAPTFLPIPVAASPAPVPMPVRQIDVAATLESARGKVNSDVSGALQDYEAIVRANTALDAVVGDLTSLIKQEGYKANAGIYRVLGDGLMRQGRLQEALDTYRKALNLL